MLFNPGPSVMLTPAFISSVGGNTDVAESVAVKLLHRHLRGDFGVICADDRRANEEAIERGLFSSILSVYEIPHRVYVITDADRECTTVLLPDDY